MQRKGLGLGSKKGNAIADSITVVVVIFAFIIMIIVGKIILGDINTDAQADPDISSEAKERIQAMDDRYSDFWDGLFIFAFILIWALMLVASFVVDSHPIFAIFTVILMIAVFFVAIFMGNAYEELSADAELATAAATFPMANWIMTHMLQTMIVVAFSVVLVLFGKNRIGQ